MSKQTLKLSVDGMSCQHCVKAVKTAVGALKGVDTVEVNLENKKVTVEFDPGSVTPDSIKTAIEGQGYTVL